MKTKKSAITIGIDLGDRKHAVCVLDAKGEVLKQESITNTRASLTALSRRHPGALMVMEVGMHSPWTSRFLTELGHRVLVANPRKVRAIYQNDRKSDRKDAEMLARIARSDETLLHPVKHVSEEMQRDLLQIKLRDNLVRQRVDIISSVRFTLKSLGIALPSPNSETFARHARNTLKKEHSDMLALIEPSLGVLDAMTQQIRKLEKSIAEMATEKYPEYEFLTQITGVGLLTSMTFILTIGDPTRFARKRDVGAFLGLVPKRDQSGETDKQLHISKAGDSYLRKLLVGCAQYILGPFGPDTALKRKGLKIAGSGGARAKRKAVVAVARNLAVLLLTLWHDEEIYQANHRAA
ncbi:MAG: IS110 family transposase [Luteolibacter sp.]